MGCLDEDTGTVHRNSSSPPHVWRRRTLFGKIAPNLASLWGIFRSRLRQKSGKPTPTRALFTGSNVKLGVLDPIPAVGAVIDNANLSGLGDVSRREPKLTNSSVQILFFRRALKRLPKGTPILENKGALGNVSLPDDSTAPTEVLVRDCTSRCTASAIRLMEREEFWVALVDSIAVFTAATIDETIASERSSDPTPDVDTSMAAWEGGISTGSGTNCTLTVSSAGPAVRRDFLRGGTLINKAYKT